VQRSFTPPRLQNEIGERAVFMDEYSKLHQLNIVQVFSTKFIADTNPGKGDNFGEKE